MLRRSALLVKGGSLGAVDESLEDERAAGDSSECPGSDGEVVADEVELGEAGLAGKVELPGMGDDDGVSVDDQSLGGLLGRHGGWMRQLTIFAKFDASDNFCDELFRSGDDWHAVRTSAAKRMTWR